MRRSNDQKQTDDYLRKHVWPGIPSSRVSVLRQVLHNAPYRVRTAKDAARLRGDPDTLISQLDVEFHRRGKVPVCEAERQALIRYLTGDTTVGGDLILGHQSSSQQLSEEQMRPTRKVRS